MAYIFDLPEEVLLKIFKFYIAIEKQRKLISCIGEVCKLWRRLSAEPDLWRKCDGSLTNHQLRKLCKSGNMKHAQELILGKKTNMKSISEIFRYLSNLRSIDFSNVKCVTSDCMSSLGEHCINLREIKFSRNLNYAHYSISPKFIYNFLELRGANLIVLDISYTDISCLPKLLLLVSKFCFCLQELLIYNVQIHGGSKFPLDAVQNGCPNIKVLRLDFQIAFTNHQTAQLPGFPALEAFTRSSVYDCYFSDQDLNNVLFRSSQLKVLDIRGCKSLSIGAILSLPATNLEKLFISYTNLHSTEKLSEILEKWNESLSILDLSRMKSRFFDHVLINFFSDGRLPKLESLDLNNTNVSAKAVIMIIQNCENLTVLNLTSCRNVGRGFMRTHRSKMELKKLLNQLSDISFVEVI